MNASTRSKRRRARALAFGFVVLVLAMVVAPASQRAEAAPAGISGSGSTYVGLAMQQWTADAQTNGLNVEYLGVGSPAGLTAYANGLKPFAGTEAEFSALGGTDAPRGYQYVPDVAGAISVMYNVNDKGGNQVDYLHLSMRTVARIFTGDITVWSDAAITADNGGIELPAEPITVVYRQGQSGTTALFYDFVAHAAPDVFGPWAARNRLPTNVRIIQLDSSPGFVPKPYALGDSDQIAQFVAGNGGKWSIAYDEFGYALTYGAQSAWIQNASGNWVLPYAQNISAALESATLREDLSQELSGVYASPNPEAYPISAYSYLVTQCASSPDRPTCRGAYASDGISETFTIWMRYIACEGQVNMARIGYSPLPPNLSQEVANSVGRLKGTPPEQLNADNCANPRFRGSLGEGASSPKDPLVERNVITPSGAPTGGGADPAAAAADPSSAASNSRTSGGLVKGGSTVFRDASPTAYVGRGAAHGLPVLPLLVFLAAIALPALAVTLARRFGPDTGTTE